MGFFSFIQETLKKIKVLLNEIESYIDRFKVLNVIDLLLKRGLEILFLIPFYITFSHCDLVYFSFEFCQFLLYILEIMLLGLYLCLPYRLILLLL